MNDHTLRIGVLGAGGRGRIAQYAHRPGEGSLVTASCDIDPQVLDECLARYGADHRTFRDGKAFLSAGDMDAVMICTPDFLHEEQTLAALEAGYDVFCEKPLAITIEGCDRVLATAARLNRKIFVGHNMRYMDFTRTMKQIIDAGTIGEVRAVWCRHFISYGGDAYFRDWHADRRNTTGLLLQKGAHDLDIIHWLAGAPSVRVTAMGSLSVYDKGGRRAPGTTGSARFDEGHWPPLEVDGLNPTIDIEDHSMVLLELANGVQASYEQCHFSPDAWRNYTVLGTRGRIENCGDFSGNTTVQVFSRRNDRFAEPDVTYRMPDPGKAGHGDADERIVREFLAHVRTGCPTWTSPLASRDAVAAGYQATVSLRSGSVPLAVPRPSSEILTAFGGGESS